MTKSEIKPGTEYVFREKRSSRSPIEHVRAIEHVRKNKWKVEWIYPNPGLVDYVESGQLLVPWKERKAFLRDEENERRLSEHNRQCGYDSDDSPIGNALSQVFESTGDAISYYRGVVSGSNEVINRFRQRVGFDPAKPSSFAYIDRFGTLRLPLDEAIELAQKFCAVEPAAVLLGVETTERKWEIEARHGEDHLIELLNEYRASWALIRQWAGHDAAIAQREDEIQRLERLVWDAIYALQKAGLERESARLRRAILRE